MGIAGALLVFPLVVFAYVHADVFYFNDEIDGFFGQLREDIRLANNSRWPLPDVRAGFKRSMFLFSVTGDVNLTGGDLRDVATVRRTSNVTILTAREYFIFRGEFGFDDLTVDYKYKARFMGIPLEGDLEVTVGDNSVYLELLMNLTNTRCSGNVVTVRDLRFSRLERISGHLTGLSVLNGAAGWWLRRQLASAGASVLAPIQHGVAAFLEANLRQFDFCRFGRVPDNLPFTDDVEVDVDSAPEPDRDWAQKRDRDDPEWNHDLTVIEPDRSLNAVMS